MRADKREIDLTKIPIPQPIVRYQNTEGRKKKKKQRREEVAKSAIQQDWKLESGVFQL